MKNTYDDDIPSTEIIHVSVSQVRRKYGSFLEFRCFSKNSTSLQNDNIQHRLSETLVTTMIAVRRPTTVEQQPKQRVVYSNRGTGGGGKEEEEEEEEEEE